MKIETEEYYGGTYPEPNEKYKRAKGVAVIVYEFDDTFPIDLTDEEIYDYIEQNADDYKKSYTSIKEFSIEEEVE